MTRRTKNHFARPETIKRIIIYALLVLFLSVAQCAFFSQLDICPATPDLVIGVVAAIALLDSVGAAASVGIALGFATDALGSSASFAFSPIFYLIVAILLGSFAEKMLPRFMSWVLLLLPALVLRSAYTALCICISTRALPSLSLLGAIIIPELIVTAILSIPLYPLVKLCVVPMRTRTRPLF